MKRLLITVGICLICLSFSAQADQDDAQLDHLFAQLHTLDNPNDAGGIIQKIWDVWILSTDDKVNKYMSVGMEAMVRQDLAIALRAFDKVIELAPEFAEGWNKRATLYYMMGAYRESLHDVAATLALEPRHFGAVSGKGLIFLSTGDLRLALMALEEAIIINPHMPSIHKLIKEIKQEMNDSAI